MLALPLVSLSFLLCGLSSWWKKAEAEPPIHGRCQIKVKTQLGLHSQWMWGAGNGRKDLEVTLGTKLWENPARKHFCWWKGDLILIRVPGRPGWRSGIMSWQAFIRLSHYLISGKEHPRAAGAASSCCPSACPMQQTVGRWKEALDQGPRRHLPKAGP